MAGGVRGVPRCPVRTPAESGCAASLTEIEGGTDPFQCTEIRRRGAGRTAAPEEFAHPCGISIAMRRAELAWRRELADQTLADLIANTPSAAERRARRFLERSAWLPLPRTAQRVRTRRAFPKGESG
ncbi:Predicted transcriptional regulator of 4-carboxymuconolactone decarboxylase, Rrf2 family [Gulosibacter sp. 10]|nr:Predicted transcriptional regulator of 4-carboxymuconolactone decarboxylase, Rrf2 family [Gulosibacter sp. 10]